MSLSKAQLNALTMLALAGKSGSTAYDLGVRISTLEVLRRRGLVVCEFRVGEWVRLRKYIITELGYKAHRDILDHTRR